LHYKTLIFASPQ
jgi:hypothetical protein